MSTENVMKLTDEEMQAVELMRAGVGVVMTRDAAAKSVVTDLTDEERQATELIRLDLLEWVVDRWFGVDVATAAQIVEAPDGNRRVMVATITVPEPDNGRGDGWNWPPVPEGGDDDD